MSDHKDNFIDEEFRLEDILAEFSTKPLKPPSDDLDLPWPEAPRREHKMVAFPSAPEEDEEEEFEEESPAPPPPPKPEEPKVLEFPGAAAPEKPEGPPAHLDERIERLKRKADAFADQMFEQEGVEVSERTRRIQRLIPGVDEEQTPPPAQKQRRERKARKPPDQPPDLSPGELYKTYHKGLAATRLRWLALVLLSAVQLALMLLPAAAAALPAPLNTYAGQVWLSTGLLAAAALLSVDIWGGGMLRLCLGKPGMDSLLGFAVLASLTDGATMLTLAPRETYLPYCGVVTVCLTFALRGTYLKRRALRLACRTAAAAQEPYLVTLDEEKWNGRPTYTKHPGAIHGFGSQIQTEDGAQRMFRLAAPVILLACILLSLLASVGRERTEYLPWCLSATLTAASALGSLLCYAKPYHALTRRLSAQGAALAGWEGISQAGRSIVLTDGDLFPPGTVSINGIKVFGDFSIEKVVGVTATLIRESGSRLEKLFHDLLRSQGAVYRRCSDFTPHEGGGMSAVVRDQRVLVGSAAFMALNDVPLPQGLNVKNAVFCAIDGELACIFALNYTLHGAIAPALHALIQNRVSPVLASRDFNLIPAMLRQRFKLPVEKMEYPAVERRFQLSDPQQEHAPLLTAVLCREGLSPLSEAVVGSQRLRRATVLNSVLTCLGSVVGVLLTFYLALELSFYALAPVNLLVFLLMWLVPVYLVSGWVNQY